jgi:hypothetical protein
LQGNGNGIAELEAVFKDRPDLIFRYFPEVEIPYMRWQCGREVADFVTLPDSSGLMIERFELLAWAESAERLIEKLSC